MQPVRRSRLFPIVLVLSLVLNACTGLPAPAVFSSTAPTAAATAAPLAATPAAIPTPNKGGTVEKAEITSQALTGNLIGDPATRTAHIWLPPSYYASEKRYPVIYVLHDIWQFPYEILFKVVYPITVPDGSKNPSTFGEVILVAPDATSVLNGSPYHSSPTVGDYDTYLAQEVVDYVDANYRTLADPASRGITGLALGGMGAMHLALMYPDVFGVVVGVSGPYDLSDESYMQRALETVVRVPTEISDIRGLDFRESGILARVFIAIAAGDAANPEKPPLYLDMPFEVVDGKAQVVQEVWQKLIEADTLHDVDRYLDQPERLHAILILHGTKSEWVNVQQAQALDQRMTERGIPHEYVETPTYQEETFNAERILQFMSQNLVFEVAD